MNDLDQFLRDNRPEMPAEGQFLIETNARLAAVEGIKKTVDTERRRGRAALLVALAAGVVLGCLGSVVAALALRGVYRIIAAKIYDTLAFFPLIPENPFLHYVTAAILICGMLIGALGSTISLKRFLNA